MIKLQWILPADLYRVLLWLKPSNALSCLKPETWQARTLTVGCPG